MRMKTEKISKAEAMRIAAKSVSIHGRRTSWTIVGPYRYCDPKGPYTQLHRDSYAKARRCATAWRARIALNLLTKFTPEMDWVIVETIEDKVRFNESITLRGLVNIGLEASK